jgi:hypothetical protein
MRHKLLFPFFIFLMVALPIRSKETVIGSLRIGRTEFYEIVHYSIVHFLQTCNFVFYK